MKWQIETIIWDFDGVLADTWKDIANATNFVMESLGRAQIPPGVIAGYIGGGAEPLLRQCLADRAEELLPQALPLFAQRYREYGCVETALYPGVREFLGKCRQAGYRMAINTNKFETLTQEILRRMDIQDYFQVMIGLESIKRKKPDPESVNVILERMGTPPAQALMVGDTWMDIGAGKAAGTVTCGVTYGYGKPGELEEAKPDFIVNRLEEMLDNIEPIVH